MYNTAFQAYSMAGMAPAALFTSLAIAAPYHQPFVYLRR
jgi:hypothetical protein